MKLTFDEVCKALLVLLMAVFLYLYYLSNNAGRYLYIEPDKTGYDDVSIGVFDTKTGTCYLLIKEDVNKNWAVLSPFSKYKWIPESK
ncbi:MAG: hypothetical protein HGB32_07380 [Geobacteraceae bacterium]|nr:hypothetical protein [Geobacteraceae bacterium]NTW79953.1 hypothetical protein [Geobacteraceae bacterium]